MCDVCEDETIKPPIRGEDGWTIREKREDRKGRKRETEEGKAIDYRTATEALGLGV
jgi:hypothetical protein